MEKNDDSPEDVKRATSIEREIKRGEKDDAFEGYLHHEKKKRWEHCGKTSKKKKQKTKSNGDCCETRNGEKGKAKRFMKISVAGEPCTFPKVDIIPRHCLTKEDYIELLATPSRKCPPDCDKKTVLRRLRPISRRIKELAQPPRQRMLISLQQGAAVLPPALLDNLARTLENETCLSPEQAAIVSRKKKLVKKRKEKNQTWRQKETSKSSKSSMGTAIAGSLDKDSISCQYLMAERFVKSILRWKCPIPKSEFNDISKVIVERLVDVLEYTPSHNEDRKWQQLRALADMIACWMSGVLSDVARHQEEKLENICKKKAEEWAAAEEEEDEDEYEDKKKDDDDDDDDDDEDEDEHVDAKEDKEMEEHPEEDSTADTKDEAEDVTEMETQADDQDSKAVETEHVDTADVEVETDQATAPVAKVETGIEGEGAGTETETKAVTKEEIDATSEADTKAETPTTEESPVDATIESTEDDTSAGKSLEEGTLEEEEEGEEEVKDEAEEEEEEEERKEQEEEEEAKVEAKEEEAEEGEGVEAEEAKEEAEAEAEEEEEEEEVEEEVEEKEGKGDGDLPEGERVETDDSATPLPGEKVTPEDEKWKDILVGGDLEELFKSDIPFVTFGKIIDTIYKMIECTPDNAGKDPITNAIHRVIYEKLTNIVMLEDPNILTEEMKDVVDVVCGKIANWLKTILNKSQVAFMEQCMPVVESKEIRDWTKWLEHVSNEALDWNIWLRGVIEKMFEMRCSKMTRGEWKDWTKSVDTGALLWRRFHLQTIHQAHRNITMMIGRRIVKTGTKTPCTTSEQLIAATELQAS